jgi:branched-chain amino acid transport system permease protein
MSTRRLFSWPALIFLVVLVIVLPFIQRPVVAAEILAMGIAAVATNVLLGYGGMLSFGQAAFFGFGAYAAGILVARFDVPALAAIPAATVATALLALPIGLVCVRRTGLYFIMITFAFNQMLYFIAYSWSTMTGGEDGLPGVSRPHFLASQGAFYAFVAVVFLLALAAMKRIVDSPTGRILEAIRDNPARAAATGHDVGRYKLVAFIISGLFTGLAGALFAFVFEFVPIDKIHWLFSGDIVFMTLVGGTQSFVGPVVGAVFYIWLQDTVSLYWNRWPMVLGIVFALVVLFFRTGITGMVEAGYARLGRGRAKRRGGESREAAR